MVSLKWSELSQQCCPDTCGPEDEDHDIPVMAELIRT